MRCARPWAALRPPTSAPAPGRAPRRRRPRTPRRSSSTSALRLARLHGQRRRRRPLPKLRA
eukprot:5081591-Alexandrium_andersonii.AAC.1